MKKQKSLPYQGKALYLTSDIIDYLTFARVLTLPLQKRLTFPAYAEEIKERKLRPERKLENTMKYKVPDENYTLENLIRKQEEKLNEGK